MKAIPDEFVRPNGKVYRPRRARLTADHSASVTPSPQGMAVVPVTYHDDRQATRTAPTPTDRTDQLDPARWATIRAWRNP